ncbi:hypothetical protein C7974DRAFT_371355 [Boeremia exigua]|uniref:uncharacterized protein n=1 Tax=Boeremia exigua TaxID=749465 RepID=UPI001E8E23AB|nr:uncharacterized protein C7974DRAFT_371355 [Boeremia exigua]KAH6644215.1 hypothetical protein C7974DRAFT_371355 [Boeremia exigua]
MSSKAPQEYAPILNPIELRLDSQDLDVADYGGDRDIELDTIDTAHCVQDRLDNFRSAGNGLDVETAESTVPLVLQDRLPTAPLQSPSKPPTMSTIEFWSLNTLVVFIQGLIKRFQARLLSRGFHGWRTGVLLGSCMSASVLCLNIVLLIVGCVAHGGFHEGISTLGTGTISDISRWSTVVHLLINACSTTLLSASNYTMQVLNSPTREEIDHAHRKGQWLDIGVLSFRNLRRITWRRSAICLLLAVSSIPLHFFYNSAIFQVSEYNSYRVAAVDITSQDYVHYNASSDTYYNLTNTQWRDAYSIEPVSGHGNLIFAIDRLAYETSKLPTNRTFPASESFWCDYKILLGLTKESWEWIRYDGFPRTELHQLNKTNGTLVTEVWPISAHVAHAFAVKTQPASRLQLSLYYMLIVIFFNTLKLALMVWALLRNDPDCVVTLGDAAASFLKRPDPITLGCCNLGKDEALYKLGYDSYHHLLEEELQASLLRAQGVWLPKERRYFSAVGRDRHVFYFIMFVILISGTFLILLLEINHSGGLSAWGTSSRIVIPTKMGPMTDALLVNLPQFLISWSYIILNGICTAMASAREWNKLATSREGLRVTMPQGEQRSTYFLQLPLKRALPLMTTSGLLHWLMSQSFFVVRANLEDVSSRLVGARRMQQKMPLAASCSLVISAACHAPSDEHDPHLKKVRWGVIEKSPGSGYTHCSITAKEVQKPITGQRYM